jgi:hypothetical protein
MAVNNLITLPEYAKGFAKEDIRRTVIEMFTQKSDVLEVMPFEIAARREVHRLPRGGAAGAAVPRHQRGVLVRPRHHPPFDEATYIIDHDIDVDRAIQDRHGPERRNYEERMGITAAARLWVDTFIKGDQSTNPRIFNGIQLRSNLFGRKLPQFGRLRRRRAVADQPRPDAQQPLARSPAPATCWCRSSRCRCGSRPRAPRP